MYDQVVDVISTRFGIDPQEVTAQSSFNDLGLDSLSQIELATALKKRLGIEIADEDMAEMRNVAEIVAKLETVSP
jgi:acyl carrier protein